MSTKDEVSKEACDERHVAVNTAIERLQKQVVGDGNAGLSQRVAGTEQHLKSVDADLEKGHRRFQSLEARMGQVVILLVVTALLSGGTFTVKLLELAKIIP